VTLRFEMLGVLRRLAGAERVELEVDGIATIGDAIEALATKRPELRAELARCAVAIGDAIVLRRDPVSSGATLALLPPVAGG
jgi:molybdopterin converting factor small subunit